MTVSFQTNVLGGCDIKQVNVDVASGEESGPSVLPVPLRDEDDVSGLLMGVGGMLTYPDGNPFVGVPINTGDQVVVQRVYPTTESSTNVIFYSVNPSSGAVRFQSGDVVLSSLSGLNADGKTPLFACYPGDLLAVSCDAVTDFLMHVEQRGQFGYGG